MKRIVLLTTTLLLGSLAHGQRWLPEQINTVKYDEIVAAYEQKKQAASESAKKGTDGEPKEGKDYHFGRWAWYWQSHLDENGRLASPLRTLEAWKQHKASMQASAKYSKTTNMSQWSFVGLNNASGGNFGIGRINGLGFHPSDSNTFIVATAGGGAWRTTDGGGSWTCLTDNLPVLGTSDVDYNPQNPNSIFLCTGDAFASDTYSLGLLKSTDGGLSWDTTGLKFNRSDLRNTNCLVMNPMDTNSLTLATSVGIMKSYDGGITWTTRVNGNFKQVLYNPADTNVLYGSTSNSGAVYRSADGGQTWQSIISFPDAVRAAIAVTPAAPNIVKAVFATTSDYALHGIYSSSDSGKTFTKIFGDPNDCTTNILASNSNLTGTTCTGQGWYDLAIAISPLDSNKVYVGGVNTYQSLNGGYAWTIVNQWTTSLPGVKQVHADKHHLAFNPVNPTALYECNDGGIYKTYNPATLWSDLSNGLQITQFYRIAHADLASFVIGGAQDNGTRRVTFTGGSNSLTGGDGMDCQIDYTNPNTFYTSSQYGNFRRTTNNGGNFTNISNNIPGDPDGAWITPLVLHPFDPQTLVVGYEHIFASFDQGDTWMDISPTLGTANDFTRLSMTPADPNYIYGLLGSTIRYTTNFGSNWSTLPLGFSGAITDLLADPTNKNHVWVTFGGYTTTKVAEYTIGGTWTKFQDSLPNVPVQCIAADTSNGTLYVGTDIGVFYRDGSMNAWAPFNTGLPAIEVTDISINYATNELWASTYGRGIWKSPKHMNELSVSHIPMAMDVISVAPNPSRGQFTVLTGNATLKNQPVTIRLLSLNGAMVFQSEGRFDGAGKLAVDAGTLARGTYLVEISKGAVTTARTKMVIL